MLILRMSPILTEWHACNFNSLTYILSPVLYSSYSIQPSFLRRNCFPSVQSQVMFITLTNVVLSEPCNLWSGIWRDLYKSISQPYLCSRCHHRDMQKCTLPKLKNSLRMEADLFTNVIGSPVGFFEPDFFITSILKLASDQLQTYLSLC